MSSPAMDPVQALAMGQGTAALDPVEALAMGQHVAPPPPSGPVLHQLPAWAKAQGVMDPYANSSADPSYSGSMTSMLQGPTMNWGDELVGAGASLQHNLGALLTGKPTHFAQDYADVRDAYRDGGQRYMTVHPRKALAGQIMMSLPAMGAGAADGVAKAPGLVTQMARAGTIGGLVGGAAGAGSGTDLQSRVSGGLGGAEVGTALGAATVPVAHAAAWAGSKLAKMLAGNPGEIDAATQKAANILLGKIEDDKLDPAAIAEQLRADPTGQMTVSDVGGENSNTQRLARALVTLPGKQSSDMTEFMNARNAGQTGRVVGAVTDQLADGGDVYQLGDALQKAKMDAAKPLYEAAGIPSSAGDYAAAPVIDTPEVQSLLKDSKDVQSAIAQAKRLPAYKDLPDNSIVLLDKAYKNIGGSAYEARIAGNGEKARDLNGLRGDLLDAITGGDAEHPYQQALNAYSGASDTQDALKSGMGAFNQDARLTAQEFQALRPGDKQFYQIGYADALQRKLNSAADSRDAVKVIYGNNNIRANIANIFGPDAAQNFDSIMAAEKTMHGTSQFLTGGSQTTNKIGDVLKKTLLRKVLGDAVLGGTAGLMTGHLAGVATGAVGVPLANIAKDFATSIAEKSALSDPDVAAKLGQLLVSPGSRGADALDELIAGQGSLNAQEALRRSALARHILSKAPLAGVIAGAAVQNRDRN